MKSVISRKLNVWTKIRHGMLHGVTGFILLSLIIVISTSCLHEQAQTYAGAKMTGVQIASSVETTSAPTAIETNQVVLTTQITETVAPTQTATVEPTLTQTETMQDIYTTVQETTIQETGESTTSPQESMAGKYYYYGWGFVPIEGADQTIFSNFDGHWTGVKEFTAPELPAGAKVIKPYVSMEWYAKNFPSEYEKIKDLLYIDSDGLYRTIAKSDYCVAVPAGLGGVGLGYRIGVFFDVGIKPSDKKTHTYETAYAPDGTMFVSQLGILVDPDKLSKKVTRSGDISNIPFIGYGLVTKVFMLAPAQYQKVWQEMDIGCKPNPAD